MISMEQINGEIDVLEKEVPTHLVMQKLAALYTVRDHMTLGSPAPQSSIELQMIPTFNSDTEFLKAVEGKNIYTVMNTINELMDTLHVINAPLYNSFIRKLP